MQSPRFHPQHDIKPDMLLCVPVISHLGGGKKENQGFKVILSQFEVSLARFCLKTNKQIHQTLE